MRSNKDRTFEFDMEIALGETDTSFSVVVEYKVISPGYPAIMNPPEMAQPEEYPEVEVQSVGLVTLAKYKNLEVLDSLDNETLELIEEAALENIAEQDEPDEPDSDNWGRVIDQLETILDDKGSDDE
tara:strand:+ start:4311 stop:4691 length:381 start_codon:yes stop_codon:yes gene_type:complete